MRRVNPMVFAAAAIALALLLAALFLFRGPEGPDQDKLSGNESAGSPAEAGDRCGAQRTYDEVKRELFRRAAEARGRDQAEFDRIAAYASVRVERPLLRDRDEELGTLRCSGRLSIDLPPGVAVVGGRRTLSADIDYVLQPAADGSGDVVMLEGADPIIVPLATLARSGEARTLPSLPETPPTSPVTAQPAPITPVPSAPQAAPDVPPVPANRSASARPSFNCRYARTRSEIAVCGDPGLASLDRQMAAQYYRAISNADRRQRMQLVRSRDAFLRFRDRCASDACIAETYRGRMREIRDIMAGTWRPRS